MQVLNQGFQGRKFADTAFPLAFDRVEVFAVYRINTHCRVFDHNHRWRTGDDFAGFIVFG